MRTAPMVKTLLHIPGVDKPKARLIRQLIRADRDWLITWLDAYPKTKAWRLSCYNEPRAHELRAHMLDELLETHGLEVLFSGESLRFDSSNLIAEYLNAGDPYTATLVFFRNRWQVLCWGDLAERYLSD